MARRGFKPLAKGGHVHNCTDVISPNYNTGGTINKMGAGGALYAEGGGVKKMRKVAHEVIGEHVKYPAPQGHGGLGQMIRRGR